MLHPKLDDDCFLSGEYLSEKFSLLVTPSLMKFKENHRLVLPTELFKYYIQIKKKKSYLIVHIFNFYIEKILNLICCII